MDEAVAAYRIATDAKGYVPWPLGELLEKHGRVDEAIAVYESGVAAGHGHLRGQLSKALFGQGRIDDAIRVVRDAIQDGQIEGYGTLGYLLAKDNREDELRAEFQRMKDAGAAALFEWIHFVKGVHEGCHGDASG